MLYRLTVGAVVYKIDVKSGERLFLAVRKPGWRMDEWSIVQGGVEHEDDFSLEMALFRELAQELGVEMQEGVREMILIPEVFTRVFSEETIERYPYRVGFIGKKIHYFVVQFVEGVVIKLGEELEEGVWLSEEKFLASVKYATELKTVVEFLKKSVVHNDLILPVLEHSRT